MIAIKIAEGEEDEPRPDRWLQWKNMLEFPARIYH